MTMNQEVDMNLQFALLGQSGVGKTSLFEEYFDGWNVRTQATIIPSQKKKIIVVPHLGCNVRVNLCVWDTAGMERFQQMMPQYYRATHGFIIVYDITCRESFEGLNDILVNAETFATIEEHAKIVVGNKIDQANERQVSRAEGLRYAQSKNCLFTEASAFQHESVVPIFEMLAEKILSSSKLWTNMQQESTSSIHKPIHVRRQPSPVRKSSSECWC